MNQGRFLAELRRSNAAGLHNHRPSRSQLKIQAIEEETNMGDLTYIEDYRPTGDTNLDTIEGPTDEELDAIEDEEDVWPEDEYPYDDDLDY